METKTAFPLILVHEMKQLTRYKGTKTMRVIDQLNNILNTSSIEYAQ